MAMEKYNVVKAYAWSGQLGKRWSQELDKEHMLFEEAASRGHLTSIDQLGRIYLDGRGVVPALRWPSAGSRMRRTRGSSLPGPHRRSIPRRRGRRAERWYRVGLAPQPLRATTHRRHGVRGGGDDGPLPVETAYNWYSLAAAGDDGEARV